MLCVYFLPNIHATCKLNASNKWKSKSHHISIALKVVSWVPKELKLFATNIFRWNSAAFACELVKEFFELFYTVYRTFFLHQYYFHFEFISNAFWKNLWMHPVFSFVLYLVTLWLLCNWNFSIVTQSNSDGKSDFYFIIFLFILTNRWHAMKTRLIPLSYRFHRGCVYDRKNMQHHQW